MKNIHIEIMCVGLGILKNIRGNAAIKNEAGALHCRREAEQRGIISAHDDIGETCSDDPDPQSA